MTQTGSVRTEYFEGHLIVEQIRKRCRRTHRSRSKTRNRVLIGADAHIHQYSVAYQSRIAHGSRIQSPHTDKVALSARTINNTVSENMVAGMYLNRYNAGMPLQADPTVKFAVKQFDLHRVSGSILRVSSPYNTYTHIGLPPGPIRIPTVESLEAVLNRTRHDYFFMKTSARALVIL